jgi:hypothetical protein
MDIMIYKTGDLISFNGQYEETKDVYFSGIRRTQNPHFCNEPCETKILVAQPHSKFRVKEANYPYYLCEKLWEKGDEEIPVGSLPVLIHINEVIPYLDEWDGSVKNVIKSID